MAVGGDAGSIVMRDPGARWHSGFAVCLKEIDFQASGDIFARLECP